MKNTKLTLLSIFTGLVLGLSTFAAVTPGINGGTGLSTSTASNDGKCLVESSSTPFLTWSLGPCTSMSTTTINGVSGPTFTFSIVSTSSASSITTTSAQLFLNLLKLSSSSQITITSTGTIVFASNNISQFTNDSGYVTSMGVVTSTNGIANTVPLWTSASALGNSIISQSSNVLTVSGAATSTISSATGTTSYFASVDNYFLFPSVAQLAAGATCGTTRGDTDAGQCMNDIYSYGQTLSSTTNVIVPGAVYSYTTPIVFGTQDKLVHVTGAPGEGTVFNYTPTSGIALTLNDCNSNAKRQATQLEHFNLTGVTTSAAAATEAIRAGGSNGACATTINDLTIRTFTYGLHTSSNTYMFSFNNSLISNVFMPVWQDKFSNSGEHMSYNNNNFVDPPSNASRTQCVFLDVNSTASTVFNHNSFDNCGVQVAAGNLTVDFNDNHHENPTRGLSGYTYIDELSSTNTRINVHGGTAMNDATSSAESPMGGVANSGYFNCGSYMNVDGIEFNRNGSATTTVYGITNTNASGNCVVNAKNIGISTTPFTTAVFRDGGVAISPSNCPVGDLYGVQNNYPAGWCFIAGNKGNFYASNNGVGMNFVGNVAGGASPVNWRVGDGAISSSTFEDAGTFGLNTSIQSVSTTISGSEAGSINGASVYLTTASVNTTYTLPRTSSTSKRIYSIVNNGTGIISLVTTSTDVIGLGVATTTSYSITPSGFITIIADNANGRWWTISRSPQRYQTPSISGVLAGAGTCDTATTTVDSWVATSTSPSWVFPTAPNNDPSGATVPYFFSRLVSTGLVQTYVCAAVALTPTASTYTFTVN